MNKAILIHDWKLAKRLQDGKLVPATDELEALYLALEKSGSAIGLAFRASDLPVGSPSLIVVHPALDNSEHFSVSHIRSLAPAHPNLHFLLVSSSAGLYSGIHDVPANVRGSQLPYTSIPAEDLRDLAQRIQEGRGWDEASPLLRAPLMNSSLALYLLFLAGRLPTQASDPSLFEKSAQELKSRGTSVTASGVTESLLRDALQSSFSSHSPY